MTFSIEYRVDTKAYEVKEGTAHRGLRATAAQAYALVEQLSDASTPHLTWINVPQHLQHEAILATPHRYR